MAFQLLVLVFILLITSYLATQGWLSATLLFISAAFGSILAGGLYEPVGAMLSYSPNYGRGTAFLVVFLVSFTALRLTADMYIKGNIKLPLWVDRAGGAVVGLLTALIITGSLAIGVQLMPLHETAAGWNRYPDGIGSAEARKNSAPLWLHPDDFVTWIYEMTLGRSMGGAYGEGSYTFAQAHPDLGEELWGRRHKVQASSAYSLSDTLLQSPVAWKSEVDKEEGYVVRMTVLRGDDKIGSIDKDGLYFRATDSQIRLVAVNESGDAQQYFPVGYFEKGTTFIKLGTGEGRYSYIQDDYTPKAVAQTGTIGEQSMYDLAFQVKPGFKPKFLDVKGARKDIKIEEALVKADVKEYPPQGWREELFKVSFEANQATKIIPGLKIWVTPPMVSKRLNDGMMFANSQTLEDNTKAALDRAPSAFLPTKSELNPWAQVALNAHNGPELEFSLDGQVIPTILWASLEPIGGGNGNAARARDALETKLKPIISKGIQLSTTNKGSSEEIQLAPGGHCIVAWFYDEKNTLFVWYQRIEAQPRVTMKYTLATEKNPAKKGSVYDVELTPNFIWPRSATK